MKQFFTIYLRHIKDKMRSTYFHNLYRNFPYFWTITFIAVLTTARHFVLSWSSEGQSHYNTQCLQDISTHIHTMEIFLIIWKKIYLVASNFYQLIPW